MKGRGARAERSKGSGLHSVRAGYAGVSYTVHVVVTKPLPSVEVLRNLFAYDPESGVLTRNTGKHKGHVGKHVTKNGYIRFNIRHNGKSNLYLAHRVIWALYYGEDPGENEIDHINRNRSDNRIENLRLVDRTEQLANTERNKPILLTYPDGTTFRARSYSEVGGLLGVTFGVVRSAIRRGGQFRLLRLRGFRVTPLTPTCAYTD